VTLARLALGRGTPLDEVFLLAVALAVSAIPEGLPVALTVALAVGMQRMARRNVIVRRLVAVEALGSCTFIATDKTGTLTENRLAVRRIRFPKPIPGMWRAAPRSPAVRSTRRRAARAGEEPRLARLCRAAILANEGFLGRREDKWISEGDAVDVALLVMAHKAGRIRAKPSTPAPSWPRSRSNPNGSIAPVSMRWKTGKPPS
jgi:Ca2+-transporting ATPase